MKGILHTFLAFLAFPRELDLLDVAGKSKGEIQNEQLSRDVYLLEEAYTLSAVHRFQAEEALHNKHRRAMKSQVATEADVVVVVASRPMNLARAAVCSAWMLLARMPPWLRSSPLRCTQYC